MKKVSMMKVERFKYSQLIDVTWIVYVVMGTLTVWAFYLFLVVMFRVDMESLIKLVVR